MKKLVLGLVLAAVAVGGSAFTVPKKTISENFLIQTIGGVFFRAVSANGSCLNLNGGYKCKYLITDEGRQEIPSEVWYYTTDIDDYLSRGWIEQSPNAVKGLYLVI